MCTHQGVVVGCGCISERRKCVLRGSKRGERGSGEGYPTRLVVVLLP